MSTYIIHNLYCIAEFQFHINHITVDICLFSTIPPPTIFIVSTSFHIQLHSTTQKGAHPLSWGMWTQITNPQLTSVRMHAHLPLPFPKGCGPAHSQSMEEWEREKHEGGPKKWEAHQVHPYNKPQQKLWFIFPFFHSFHQTDHLSAQQLLWGAKIHASNINGFN